MQVYTYVTLGEIIIFCFNIGFMSFAAFKLLKDIYYQECLFPTEKASGLAS